MSTSAGMFSDRGALKMNSRRKKLGIVAITWAEAMLEIGPFGLCGATGTLKQ
jgi:hypothetical protein